MLISTYLEDRVNDIPFDVVGQSIVKAKITYTQSLAKVGCNLSTKLTATSGEQSRPSILHNIYKSSYWVPYVCR